MNSGVAKNLCPARRGQGDRFSEWIMPVTGRLR
jgi:hypothetical protein